jgi:formylglycine-generating enzyme required for sulfatase activity
MAPRHRLSKTTTHLVINGLVAGTSNVSFAATDLDGNTTTQTFTVTVSDTHIQPAFTTHPLNVTVAVGGAATFTTATVGTGITKQWRKNGVNIAGQTGDSLSLTSVTLADVADYTLAITNDSGTVVSNPAALQVLQAPSVTTPPASQTKDYATSVTFSVASTGTQPLTYQWKKGSSVIAGATGQSLTLSNLKLTDAASYICTVTNVVSSVDSSAAVLTVTDLDTDGDGLMDSLEDTKGYSRTDSDTDDDGYADGLEESLGTNVKLATSNPGTTAYVALRDAGAALKLVAMTRIPSASLANRLDSDNSVTVPEHWLGTTELTNKQFAAVLQRAKSLDIIDVIVDGGRRAVRFPKTTGSIIAHVDPSIAVPVGGAVSTEISMDAAQTTFLVQTANQDLPVRSVARDAAYLAGHVLNVINGFAAKNQLVTKTFDPAVDGYYIPSYVGWEIAARAKPAKDNIYPTGATASASLAWFGQTAATAKPKKVGSYAASSLGLRDLGGNVAEWVAEFDPTNASNGIVRGGGYTDLAAALHNSADARPAVASLNKHVGIRMALKAPASPSVSQPPLAKLILTSQPLSLSVGASGAPVFSYSWFKGATQIKGQTSSTLVLAAPKVTDFGLYQAKISSNGQAPAPSAQVPVSIVETPAISSISIASNKSIDLVVKYGTPASQPLKFQWSYNGTNLSNAGSTLSGVTTPKLTLKGLAFNQTGVYRCHITTLNSTGLAPVEVVYFLTVLRTPDLTLTELDPGLESSTMNQPVTFDSDITRAPATFKAVGLPKGLTINPTTGIITGKPIQNGTFRVTITATNAFGSDTASVDLTIGSLDLNQATAIGTFTGLVDRHIGSGTNPGLNNNLGGKVTLTTSKVGTFSGTLLLGTVSYRFSGALDTKLNGTSPTASVIIARRGLPSLRLSLAIQLAAPFALTGSVSEALTPAITTAITGYRQKWNGSNVVSSAYQGVHNVALEIPTGAVGDVSIPQGAGLLVATVHATNGTVSYKGTLADGTAITGSGVLGPDGDHQIYQVLYSNTGSILGTLIEAGTGNHLFSSTSGVSWLKKTQATASTTRRYKAGFSTTLSPRGGRMLVAATPNILFGLAAPTGSPPSNAMAAFTHGALLAPVSQTFQILTPALITFPTGAGLNPNVVGVKVTNTATSGAISGSFTVADNDPTSTATPPAKITRVGKFTGLVVPTAATGNDTAGLGWFVLPELPTATVPYAKTPERSGKVVIDTK